MAATRKRETSKAKPKKPKIIVTGNAEGEAIREIDEILIELDEAQRLRVLQWAMSKYSINLEDEEW